ncbi:hypothetical protein CRG98_037499 [Punica granatum]|uniref:Uncharacterized protein n=1 Tax=Punica granatum TaxID=22663 RepID=A0A2I0IFB3_PUNGR|nr:hypothetical protein CRG98_037499 [Punica granatum]
MVVGIRATTAPHLPISLFSIEPRDSKIMSDGGPNPGHYSHRRSCRRPSPSPFHLFVRPKIEKSGAAVAPIPATIRVAGDPRGMQRPRWWGGG